MTELELQLLALREDVAWPPTPDLATVVQARVAREPRRRERRARLPRRLVPALAALLLALVAFSVLLAASPETLVLASARREALLAALGALDERDRSVLTCRYLLELSEEETAAALGCRRGTVK